MAIKFTFKKQPRETGLSSVAAPNPCTDVKLNGKVCGTISAPGAFTGDMWRPRLMIEVAPVGEEDHGNWKWIFFKAAFKTEPEAREWFNKNAEKLASTYKIRCEED